MGLFPQVLGLTPSISASPAGPRRARKAVLCRKRQPVAPYRSHRAPSRRCAAKGCCGAPA